MKISNGSTWEILKKGCQNLTIMVTVIMLGLVIMHGATLWALAGLAKCDVLGTVRIQYPDGSLYTCHNPAQTAAIKPQVKPMVVTK